MVDIRDVIVCVIGQTFPILVSPEEKVRINSAARGCYQASLLCGDSVWSGADLRGNARAYAGRYACSRASLIDRLNELIPRLTFSSEIITCEDGRQRRMLVVRERYLCLMNRDLDPCGICSRQQECDCGDYSSPF